MEKVIIYTDGAATPNPGPAAIGVVIKDEKGNIIRSISKRIGQTTNNQAEYWAVIAALEEAIKLGATSVDLKSDSELVVRQLKGMYRVRKEELKPLFQKVKQLQNSLESFQVTHIKRNRNKAADRLTKKALESGVNTLKDKKRRLIITISQTSTAEVDKDNLYKIIDILRGYPGRDEVKLRVADENKITHLRLFDIYVDYCPELYCRLAEIVGESGLKLEAIK
jgi:ribonuclease HI